MAAYAALVSLSKVIDLTLSQKREYGLFYSTEQMMILHEEIGRLQNLLEDLSSRSHPPIDEFESRIRDVSYKLEDIIEDGEDGIEDYTPSSFFVKFTSFLCMRSSPVAKAQSPVAITPSSFAGCAREIHILLEETMEMKENNLQFKHTSGASHPLTTRSSSSEAPTAKLAFNQNEIMDWIFGRGSNLKIVPITGMGGIGKTTLARAVYEHPNTKRHFDICSWVAVSQGYNVKEILHGLLPSDQQNEPDGRLIECVHKRLIGRRFLIVLDDMWDVKAWDGVKNAFYDDNKGSRIIVTTRLLDVAAYVGSSSHIHEMQFLKDEQSWDLLQEKMGRNMHWSNKLEDLGRTISRNCRGLPLAVVAMAGLLKFNMTEEYWKQVARDTTSEMAAIDDQLFSILALSYTNLPPYLKACFLYFGLFREDYEIRTEELVRLWAAEGFLKPRGSKEMEEVAEEYLEELVARSLVLVQKKKPDGRIKTCSIHDVLRDLSLRRAHKEKFYLHITHSSPLRDRYSNYDLRRASIDSYCFPRELVCHRHVRSLRYDQNEDVLDVITAFSLIRVLGKVCITEELQLDNLYYLTNLKYLHIHLSSGRLERPPLTVGESISELQNLETLVFSEDWLTEFGASTLVLPAGIWEMRCLRHLNLVKGSRLLRPALKEIRCSSLQTLTEVNNLGLNGSVTAKLSNLRKLKLTYNYFITQDTTYVYLFNNLVHLHQLEKLNVVCDDASVKVTDFSFPHKLKKLKGTNMSAENMSLIGSSQNLEVLKLKHHAFEGKEWEPIEGEFVQLKYLKMERLRLEEWRADSEHFPQLEKLVIKRCKLLKEVPAGIGEINTLQKLVLEDCKAAEESVEVIKAEQESLCNDLLQVIIIRKRHASWINLSTEYVE